MKTCFLIIPFFLVLSAAVYSFESKEYTLANGMKVCLVKTQFEKQAVCLEIFALGGTASLSKEDRPSGILSAPLVCESGFGDLTSDELFSHLYRHAIELSIEIKPFDRSVSIHGPAAELANCLQLAKEIFTHPRFDTLALQRAQKNIKEEILEKNSNPNLAAKEFFLDVNMQHWENIRPLAEQDLLAVDIKKSQQFFQQCFSNPSDFTCVIVGDIDPEATRTLLDESLGAIPPQSNHLTTKSCKPPPFPQGVRKQDRYILKNTAQAIAQITFPISLPISADLIDRLRYVCELIHAHLGVNLKNGTFPHPRIQVKYEFPNFPLFDQTWLVIAFASDPESANAISMRILSSLEDLRRNGPSEELIANLSSNKLKQEGCWGEDNGVLLTLLANIYRWGWDLKTVHRYLPDASTFQPPAIKQQNIQADLKLFIPVDQYSVLTAYPVILERGLK